MLLFLSFYQFIFYGLGLLWIIIICYISWSLFNNECALSYLFKIIQNPDYIMGSTLDVEDYNAVLGDTPAKLFLNYVLFMYVFNLLFIATRYTGLRNKLFILLLGCAYILYIRMLRSREGKHKKVLQTFNVLINTVLFGYFALNK
jgi:hypothetical protein